MTANADYGVSIVESFTPPKNWLPGQEINKDVYGVNTGNVDAFVKEDVSGILDYTYEAKVTEFGTAGNNYVELNDTTKLAIDGVTTNEAGGFLAWTNAIDPLTGERYELGSINSRREDPDPSTDTDTKDPRWTPPAAGDYIFRRAIKTESGTTTFTYAGYHFEPNSDGIEDDKYYKIVIGNDAFRADETTEDENGNKQFVFDISADSAVIGVGANEDGTLKADPVINYVIESKVSQKAVDFTYVNGTTDSDDTDDRDYLLATYTDGQSSDAKVEELRQKYLEAQAAYETAKALSDQDSAKVADAEVEYRNAEGEYNLAKKKYLQSKADFDYATALANARNDLIDAAIARKDAADTRTSTHSALDTAWANLVAGAKGIEDDKVTLTTPSGDYYVIGNTTNKGLDDDTSPISKTNIVPNEVRSAITADQSHLPEVVDNLSKLDTKWDAIKAKTTEIKTLLDAIDDDLAAGHDDTVVAHTSKADVDAKITSLNEKLDELEELLNDYKNLFANLVYAAQDATNDTVTDLLVDSSLAVQSNIDSFKNKVAGYTLDTLATAYGNAYDEYVTAVSEDETAADDWADAIAAYNAAVNNTDGAGNTYNDTLNNTTNGAASITYVPNQKDITVTNNAAGADKLIVTYSANTSNSATDASLATTPVPDYTTYAAMSKVVLPDEDTFVSSFTDPTQTGSTNAKTHSELKDNYEVTTKGVFDDKSQAYEDAKDARTTNASDTAAKLEAMNTAKSTWEAGLTADSKITLKVYLDKDWKTYWAIDSDTNGTKDVDFYLKKVLTAGETSHKLIDGVELDKTVGSKDYKDLTFDLNIGLDSIQATYDANQRGYTTEAVDADPNFAGMKAAVDDPMTEGSTVTWTNVEGVPAPANP